MKRTDLTCPPSSQLRAELEREKYKQRRHGAMRKAVTILVIAAAIAVLIASRWMPVLQIYGSSMSPTLKEGQIVITVKTSEFKPGDIIAFYFENKLLVKRYIADDGQWVDIMEDGNVFIDEELLDEPYIKEKSFETCDIELPYQVPEGRIFVMGDHRETSLDSRSKSIGCIADEQIAGKVCFCIWPISDFGPVK